MLIRHFLSQLVWLLLPCLSLAYPNHSERLHGGLSRRAGSQQQSDASVIHPWIITLPHESPGNFSANNTLGSHYPQDIDPFGPNDDESFSFDEKVDIWGDNVYIEVLSEIDHPGYSYAD